MIQIINPCKYPDWDELLLTTSNFSFYHSSAWAKVLSESYRYNPLYFSSIDNCKLLALLPIMEIKSFLTGKRGVSLPFSDCFDPIASDEICFQKILQHTVKYGNNARWKYVDYRGGSNYFKGKTPSAYFYIHTLDLTRTEKDILSAFRNSTRRNIKKALNEGVELNISNSLGSLRRFYRLNCVTRKRHGLPPQPFFFFKKIYDHIISKGLGLIALASYRNTTIAGAVFFHTINKVIYKYGASAKSHQHLRANNLIMWEAIKWYSQNGFTIFDFGITEPENKGLLQFKRGWGVNEGIINYYRYNLRTNAFEKDDFRTKVSYGFFKTLPIPLLNAIGFLLYRHIG